MSNELAEYPTRRFEHDDNGFVCQTCGASFADLFPDAMQHECSS